MSGEQLSPKDLGHTVTTSYNSEKKQRVNINTLLDKVRAEKNKDRKENYMFLGLVIGVLAVTGIIASL